MIDERCELVRSGALTFNLDGTIDPRCQAVRGGQVLVTQDGNLDARSAALNSGELLLTPSYQYLHVERTGDFPRRDWTREKKGSEADGTEGAHIVSREILKDISLAK